MRKRRGQTGNKRPHNALVRSKRRLPSVYLSETSEFLPEIYLPDPGSRQSGSRFKWLVSTCIAAIVGVTAIGMAMYASMDKENDGGVLTTLQKAGIDGMKPVEKTTLANETLRAVGEKTDRLTITSYGLSTQYIIHDRVAQKRGNRDFIVLKPYSKIVASLSTAKPKNVKDIPKFDPYKLYANTAPIDENQDGAPRGSNDITVKILDLTPERITAEDGQLLNADEIQQIVKEAGEFYDEGKIALGAEGSTDIAVAKTEEIEDKLPPKTTIIEKSADDEDPVPEQGEYRFVKIKRGDTLVSLIEGAGADQSHANAIAKAMNTIIPGIQAGQELRFILLPTTQDPDEEGKYEPYAISLFSGPSHLATVVKSGAGEYADYIASAKPISQTVSKDPKKSFSHRSNVYLSMYHAALMQNIPHDEILKILRIHSYDVDFKHRVQSGDAFEAFFDEKQVDGRNEQFGELLFTSTTIGGEVKSFYRFRTPDGAVDYYDEQGSSSRKFLMRKPVRGARYTSGFGFRYHPVLKSRKMHFGADWAAPTGTPILAAGNGIVEFVGVQSGYGNFVVLRHANGYKTAYGHMHKFASGMRKGQKIRQGQVIGYVGSTGRSTGPHLHYEVLVNNQRVNPMKIDVPRGRELTGRLLAAFQKERERINRLMRQPAVKTHVAKVEGQS